MSTPDRAWIGKLELDDWNDPMIDGRPVNFSDYEGKRVMIWVKELPEDTESYEALARSFDRRTS